MKHTHQSAAFAACLAGLLAMAVSSLAAGPAGAPALSRKKLQVFVLAGQSNMTGYCGIQTLTNLPNFHELDDPALRKLDQRLCKTVFPSEEAIRENNGLRARLYKLRARYEK